MDNRTPTAAAGRLIQLAGPPVTLPDASASGWIVGRAPDCDLVLPDPAVSRQHARIDWTPSPRISDLGSAAGIRVNGQAIQSVRLHPGDRIQIGPWLFVLSSTSEPGLATIQQANLAASLAAPRLDLLLAFCQRINPATEESEVLDALLDTAMAGSGYQRGVIVNFETDPWTIRAARPGPIGIDHLSRQLIEAARQEGAVELRTIDESDRSASIQARRISSATAIALGPAPQALGCLYLDARAGERAEQPDTARYCQALAQVASLAVDRLRHQHQLWQQREQIHADLHDDLGARLLNLIYRAPDPGIAEEARIMLQDLRDVVTRSRIGQMRLSELLAEARSEARQRAEGAGVDLVWRQAELSADPNWSSRQAALLSRTLREALSNALRHARPTRIEIDVDCDTERLRIDLSHDGEFESPEQWSQGRGTHSLAARCQALGGQVTWFCEQQHLHTCMTLALEPGQ